jgi:hypothetical protein
MESGVRAAAASATAAATSAGSAGIKEDILLGLVSAQKADLGCKDLGCRRHVDATLDGGA